LILYPTNALVEDQVARLRLAFRAISQRDPRAHLWFGRYTGVTLGTNRPARKSSAALKEVAAEVAAMQTDFKSLSDRGYSPDELAAFADPTAHELLTRWDMVAHPPDVLVTNYSMLNAILMREFEDNFFESTKSWLASDPSNAFTLVIDELHTYRGSSGTEIALLVRKLLHRLQIAPDSPQLRILATSASLGPGDETAAFLEQFFGVDRRTFTTTAGVPRLPRIDASAPEESVVGRAQQASERIAALCLTNPGHLERGHSRNSRRSTRAPRMATTSPRCSNR